MLTLKNGFSLVELLISLLLGSLLMAIVINLYVSSVSSGAKNLKYSRLRSDLQSILAVMESDIRRAGYGGRLYQVGSGAAKTVDSIHRKAQDCIVYYYNEDNSADLTSRNKMAFRLDHKDNKIQFGRGVGPFADDCYAVNNGHWESMTDNNFIKITKLNFNESVVSNASATMRSVEIEVTGELVADSQYKHTVSTKVQVRNLEYN